MCLSVSPSLNSPLFAMCAGFRCEARSLPSGCRSSAFETPRPRNQNELLSKHALIKRAEVGAALSPSSGSAASRYETAATV